MSLLPVDTVRQRVAAVIEALATPSAWRESPAYYDSFPSGAQSMAHLAFAVGVPSTSYDSAIESYRGSRGALGAAVTTEIGVRWTFRIRAAGQVADYDSAIEAEAVLLTALGAMSKVGLHYAPGKVTRRSVGDGTYLLSELIITGRHRIAIQ